MRTPAVARVGDAFRVNPIVVVAMNQTVSVDYRFRMLAALELHAYVGDLPRGQSWRGGRRPVALSVGSGSRPDGRTHPETAANVATPQLSMTRCFALLPVRRRSSATVTEPEVDDLL
jgi:hypothetical protein